MANHNFAYDDGKDNLFIHDYEIQKLFEPNKIEMNVDILNFRLIGIGANPSLPICMINFKNLRLSFNKQTNLDKNIDISGHSISAYYF